MSNHSCAEALEVVEGAFFQFEVGQESHKKSKGEVPEVGGFWREMSDVEHRMGVGNRCRKRLLPAKMIGFFGLSPFHCVG